MPAATLEAFAFVSLVAAFVADVNASAAFFVAVEAPVEAVVALLVALKAFVVEAAEKERAQRAEANGVQNDLILFITERAKRAAEKKAAEIEERAELKAKNIARNAEMQRANWKKAHLKKKYEEAKETHNQFGLAIEDMLRQFTGELRGLVLIAVEQYHDQGAVNRRRQQMANLKETMATIQMLIKMQ